MWQSKTLPYQIVRLCLCKKVQISVNFFAESDYLNLISLKMFFGSCIVNFGKFVKKKNRPIWWFLAIKLSCKDMCSDVALSHCRALEGPSCCCCHDFRAHVCRQSGTGKFNFDPRKRGFWDFFPSSDMKLDGPSIIRVNYLTILQTHREWVAEKRFARVMAQWTLHGRIKGVTGTAVSK
jgi:hypothetical protein